MIRVSSAGFRVCYPGYVRLLIAQLFLLLLTLPALAQEKTPDPIDWTEAYKREYYSTPEGREDLADRLGQLTAQQYAPEFTHAGWLVGGLDILLDPKTSKAVGLDKLASRFGNFGQYQVMFGLVSDIIAGRGGKRLSFMDAAYNKAFKDTTFWVVGTFVTNRAIKGAFWLTQGVDLLLAAFNEVLVQPFFDTYERMWWGAYEHYYLAGPGKRGLDGCSNSLGTTTPWPTRNT